MRSKNMRINRRKIRMIVRDRKSTGRTKIGKKKKIEKADTLPYEVECRKVERETIKEKTEEK